MQQQLTFRAVRARSMRTGSVRSGSFGVTAGLVLSIVLATSTAAATWSPATALSSSDFALGHDLISIGESTAVAVYVQGHDPGRVLVRRSTNSGQSWHAAVPLSNAGSSPALSGLGSSVDAVWVRNGAVRYARSTNGGASFGQPTALSTSSAAALWPDVARGPGGLVVVAWFDQNEQNVKVRVSSDGGQSFSGADLLASAGGRPALAIGEEVIYAAYSVGDNKLRIKRSLNDGATWSTPVTITSDTDTLEEWSITAEGSHAYVGYMSATDYYDLRYRRTTDRGASWSSEMSLSPPEWEVYGPQISLEGGVLRATFSRQTVIQDMVFEGPVFFSRSADGLNWSTPSRVSPKSMLGAYAAGVTHAGSTIVLYSGETELGLTAFARARH